MQESEKPVKTRGLLLYIGIHLQDSFFHFETIWFGVTQSTIFLVPFGLKNFVNKLILDLTRKIEAQT